MAYPHKLPSLTNREAIADAIYRACIAIDTNDQALFDSAIVQTEEVSFEMGGHLIKGREAVQKVFDKVGPMETSHHVSNIRVNLEDGANTATATAYGLHQHYRAGEGLQPDTSKLLAGGRYNLELINDQASGLWRLKKWVFIVVWREGDQTVMEG